MSKRMRLFINFIVTIMILFSLSSTTFAEVQDLGIIKVGYYEDGDYMSRNQYGEYVGYNIEYLQKIAKQSGLRFEIIDAVSWNAAYEMLVKGEIDLLPAVYHNDKRAQEILFSTQPMCSIYTTLNVRMDDQRYDYEDFRAFQGMNIGIIRDSVDGEAFRAFCREHKLAVAIVEYDETSKVLEALDNGRLDGVAITHLGKNSTFRSIAQFSPSPLYFTVSKSKPALLAEINKAMNSILLSNPSYGSDLYDKYLAPSINQTPVFTRDERKYIEQAKPIIVAYDPDFAPLSYQDKKTGEFRGVTADIFKFIAASSGLKFQFEAHSQPEALELLRAGKIDAICVSDGDYLWDRRNNINSTLCYLRAPTSMLTSYDSDKLEIVALPKGYQLSQAIEMGNPNYKVQYYPSIELCLEAVLSGEADAVCLNTQVAGSYLSKSAYKAMRTTTLGQYINEICIGTSADKDPRLFAILNKCIQYLPAGQIDAYLVNHTANTKEVSAAEFVEQHIWQITGIVCLVLVIIILLISYNLKNALRSNRRIQELLDKDELTALYSINGFSSKWDQNVAKTHQQDFALLYGDICQFKIINDNFGFSTGNQVLSACGTTLQNILAHDEFASRISADHFAILLKYDGWENLLSRIELFVKQLNSWRTEYSEIPYKIDFVFGVCLIGQEDRADIHQKLDFANYARRYAKDTPSNNFIVMYDEQMRNQALLGQQLEGDLDQALRNNEFTVYYQPKVDMKTHTIIGSEALIRWNHPQKGFLMPGAFIPLFEKNGMIKKVDLWLFEKVCQTMHQWREQSGSILPVSCNFSRLHFQQNDFPEQVSAIADRWNIPHDLLELEITESALLEESATIVTMLPRLKELGFKIAIDDFGSGYSSLGQLQQITAHILKLDRSFVCHGVTGKREQIVVGNIIRMASELGMTVICEGVETKDQSEILQNIDCKLAQGFYFYRPMKLEDYEALILKNKIKK